MFTVHVVIIVLISIYLYIKFQMRTSNILLGGRECMMKVIGQKPVWCSIGHLSLVEIVVNRTEYWIHYTSIPIQVDYWHATYHFFVVVYITVFLVFCGKKSFIFRGFRDNPTAGFSGQNYKAWDLLKSTSSSFTSLGTSNDLFEGETLANLQMIYTLIC